MQDAWRAYLELALGLTEASRKRAQTAARKLVGSSGATAAQLQTMAEELISTGMANREALTRIVRIEIDRTLGALGLAAADEVAALTERVRKLERELAAARVATPGGPAGSGGATGAAPRAGTGSTAVGVPTGTATPIKKAVAKKVVAKKAVAKKTAPSRAVATKTAATKAVAKKSGATKTVAKKTVAKKTVAKKTPGKAAATTKATPGKAVAERPPTPGEGTA